MKVKNSLNFRGYPKENKLTFYNGQNNELFTDNFNELWEILNHLSKFTLDESKFFIEEWREKYGIDEGQFADVLKFLTDSGIIYQEEPENSYNNFYKRNINFFNIYDNESSVFNKLSGMKCAIIGTGTVGATLALTLSKLGVSELILIDDDIVETKNIPAQIAFDINSINKRKITELKNKIINSNSYTKVSIIQKRIESIHDFIEEDSMKDINFIFGCFDNAPSQLHSDILNFCSNNNAHYILLGYNEDSIIAYTLDKENEKIIDKSYQGFDPDYLIGDNRGTIIQSYISSILASYLLISSIFKKGDKHIIFNFSDLTIKKYSSYREMEDNKFIDSLSDIYIPNQLENHIDYLRDAIKISPDSKFIEIELLSLYQYFEIISLVCKEELYNLEKIYEKFIQLFDSADNSNDVEVSDNLDNYLNSNQYYDYINNLRVNDKSIFFTLTTINSIESYDERLRLQKLCYEMIKKNSEKMIQTLVINKSNYLKSDLENTYLDSVLGVRPLSLNQFENVMKDNFYSLAKEIYSYIFPSEDIIDYLYFQREDASTIIQYDDGISLLKGLNKYLYNFSSHIDDIINNNHIKILKTKNDGNINKTIYFPTVKENRIIVNYDDTYDSLFTLCHEFGHSYFNLSYSDKDYFDVSRKIINETLAILCELLLVNNLLENESNSNVDGIRKTFLFRINKNLLSSYSIYAIEKEVIKILNEQGTFNIDDLIMIQDSLHEKLLKNIQFKNNENSYLNVLLNPSFVFDFKDHVIDPIALLVSINLFYKIKENPIKTVNNIKDALTLGKTNIEDFLMYISGEKFNSIFINNSIDNIINYLNEFKESEIVYK